MVKATGFADLTIFLITTPYSLFPTHSDQAASAASFCALATAMSMPPTM
jgi:hypothetical protein